MERVGRSLDKFIAYLSYVGVGLGIASLLAMIGMITLQVLSRRLFNKPFLFVEEIGAYFFVVIVFMGLAYTTREDAHINVELLTRRFSRKVRNGLDVVTSLVALGLMGVYVWYGIDLFLDSIATNKKSITSLATPQWIPQTFLWLGMVFISLELVVRIVKKFRAFQKGEAAEEEEEKIPDIMSE